MDTRIRNMDKKYIEKSSLKVSEFFSVVVKVIFALDQRVSVEFVPMFAMDRFIVIFRRKAKGRDSRFHSISSSISMMELYNCKETTLFAIDETKQAIQKINLADK